jgi:hypothetical protein
MHQDFSNWYRQAGIEPNAEELPKRWAAIEQYTPNKDAVVSLVRVFNRLGNPKDSFPAEFLAALQAADPAFKTRDNDQEFAVLAGAELVDVLERSESGLGPIAALSLVCAAAGNARPTPPVRDIPEIATRYVGQQSTERGSSVTEIGESGSRKALFNAIEALGDPYEGLTAELRRLQHEVSLVSEESNMLWWLFSEHSRDDGRRWNTYSVPAVALMAGKELADLTLVVPGPVAAVAFLDRVIRSAKSKIPVSVRVTDAINDVSVQWRQSYINKNYLSALEQVTPISHGIELSLASPQNDAWLPAFAEGTRMAVDSVMVPHVLAYQVFLEALLCRCWKKQK